MRKLQSELRALRALPDDIAEAALRAVGGPIGASSWLLRYQMGLPRKPMTMIKTISGRKLVLNLLRRIDYGILG
jgi:uncharacterized protein (DUF2384 family)